jgi:redox-sensitive bicupin YhaK (pirin superfamily)
MAKLVLTMTKSFGITEHPPREQPSMITIRPAEERGRTRIDWLDSRHSFSFGGYFDPRHQGVSALRVINDDIIAPGAGFPTHGHRDMEILTYVTEGVIAHQDSTGNREQVPAGEFQLMHAGSGILHSEFNASASETLRLLQIWIVPNETGGAPGYEQRRFPRQPGLQLIASSDGSAGSLALRQDAQIHRGALDPGMRVALPLDAARTGYLHVVRGRLHAAGAALAAGDGMSFFGEAAPEISTDEASEFLFFDLPPAPVPH